MGIAENPRYILGRWGDVIVVCVCLRAEMLLPAVVPSHSKSNQKDRIMARNTGKFKVEVFCNSLTSLPTSLVLFLI